MPNDMMLCMGCMKETDGGDICPRCGYDSLKGNGEGYLKPRSLLGNRYVAGAIRSKNGEGAMYVGYDLERGRKVWIKEYYPAVFAEREGIGDVIPRPGCWAQYKALMSDFMDVCNDVKRLSVSDSVIPIENVITHGNTMYAIYKDMGVITLEKYLRMQGGSIPPDKAVKMLQPICDTAASLHNMGEIHRGISPYTVFVDSGERAYLWNFALSATRTGGSEIECEMFDGYSAPEQYASNGWQGAWTDVYAVGALLYRMLSGITPLKSTLVTAQTPITPLSELVEGIPKGLSDAVAGAMRPQTERRIQTMPQFSAQLLSMNHMSSTASTAIYDLSGVAHARTTETRSRAKIGIFAGKPLKKKDSESRVSIKYVFLALLCMVIVLGGILWFVTTTFLSDMIAPSNNSSLRSSTSSSLSGSSSESTPSESSSQPEVDKTVPKFVGKKAEDIINNSAYESRFIFTQKFEYNDNYDSGVVFDQSPLEGTLMPNRGNVLLSVSKGKRIITMPGLTGQTVDEAAEIFAGLEKEYDIPLPVSYVERYDGKTEPGKIISSTPAEGEEFNPKNTSIIVYVSIMPEVSETSEQASQTGPKKDPDNPERDM